MANGTEAAGKLFDLARERPLVAIILSLTIIGSVSFGASFLGQGSKITNAVADLKTKVDDLNTKNIYLNSAIKTEELSRIAEIVTLKEDGKLLSEDSIRLMIKKELEDALDKFEDRLVARLQ